MMQKTQAALRLQVQALMSQLENCKRCVDSSRPAGCQFMVKLLKKPENSGKLQGSVAKRVIPSFPDQLI